jgi:EAL domain-containing protein (putative c-di-GMP-specific phosphodiesterase class I)
VDRLSLAVEVRDAAARQELVLHYQPQVDLATGALVAAEALMRWEHPQRGLVVPDVFIPIAENTGAIRELTAFALETAIGETRSWRLRGIQAAVAVNVTAQDVLDQQLPETIAQMLQHAGLEPEGLELELTETMLMADPARAAAVLTRLSEMGVRIAIDDFGTGYSSLGYLKQLPVDKIKIDRTFVANVQHDANDAALVVSPIDLARNLRLRAVAEGVETAGLADSLHAMGCSLGQGYLYARPLPAAEFAAYALARSAPVPRPPAPLAAPRA